MQDAHGAAEGGWVERQGRLVHLRLDGSRANALTAARYDLLTRTAKSLRPEDVLCLSSVGPTFSAGQDLHEFVAAQTEGRVAELLRRGTGAVLALLECPATVVAAVQGPAVGGGALIAAAADLVVVGPRARLRLPEIALGMPLGAAVLERLVGGPAARRLALTGDWASAAELVGLGGVVRAEEGTPLLEAALTRSRAFVQADSHVRQLARGLFGEGERERVARLYAREAEATVALWG